MPFRSKNMRISRSDSSGYYARALRAIGQDLTELFPQQLDIEYHDRSFAVRVRCERKWVEKRNPPVEKKGLKNLFYKLATYLLDKPREDSKIATMEHTYNSDEIGELDRAGFHLRTQAGKIPAINNLGEALRTIGRIVDADGGQLVRIFRDQRHVIFEYVEKNGSMHKTEMTRSELFKLQQSYYEKRDGS
jgi:hypothetical protein